MRRCEEGGGSGPGCTGGGFGPGSGRGRGRGALLEPAVLAALAEQTAHGYDLRRAVEEMTEGIVVVDPGGLYRLLRQLELEGVVASAWTEGAFGPQRREYRLTAAGRELLVQWGEDVARRERAFRSVSAAIRRSLGREVQEENAGSAIGHGLGGVR
jgi:DNA-binding PadR family transcriptional regulator